MPNNSKQLRNRPIPMIFIVLSNVEILNHYWFAGSRPGWSRSAGSRFPSDGGPGRNPLSGRLSQLFVALRCRPDVAGGAHFAVPDRGRRCLSRVSSVVNLLVRSLTGTRWCAAPIADDLAVAVCRSHESCVGVKRVDRNSVRDSLYRPQCSR